MFENSIDRKPKIKKGGEEQVNFCSPMFKFSKTGDEIIHFARVPENMSMRIDLVSISEFGNDSFSDILLKYNNISNPFSLNYNDILQIPSAETAYLNISEAILNEISENAERANREKFIRNYHKFIDPSKIPSTSSKGNDISIPKNTRYEANLGETTKKPVTIKNGRIYFGTNSIQSADELYVSGNNNDVEASAIERAKSFVDNMVSINVDEAAENLNNIVDALNFVNDSMDASRASNSSTGTGTGTGTDIPKNAKTSEKADTLLTDDSSSMYVCCAEDGMNESDAMVNYIKQNV